MDNELNEEFDIDFNISEEDRKIKIEDEDGSIKEYEIVANVFTEDGEFAVYTDNKILDNGEVLLYVNSVIRDENGNITFDDVEDDEVQNIIKEIRERLV